MGQKSIPRMGRKSIPLKVVDQKIDPAQTRNRSRKSRGAFAKTLLCIWGETFVTRMPPEVKFVYRLGGVKRGRCFSGCSRDVACTRCSRYFNICVVISFGYLPLCACMHAVCCRSAYRMSHVCILPELSTSRFCLHVHRVPTCFCVSWCGTCSV